MVVVAADRWFGWGLGWTGLAAGPAVVVSGFLGWALSRRDPVELAAMELDARLGLADRIATGVCFSGRGDLTAFEALALDDADRAAAGADAARGVPLGGLRGQRWWPIAAAGTVALAVWLPARTVSMAGSAASPEVQQAREEARERLVSAREESELELEAQPELFDEATRRDLEALRRLEEELGRAGGDADEAGAKAAERFDDAADRLREDAARERRALEALSRRMGDGGGDPLGEALSAGDFAAAGEELDRVSEALRGATAEERQAIAERLRRVAEGIDDGTMPEDVSAAERLENEGVSPERAAELAEETDPDALRRALEEEGADPIAAERIADEVARDAARREAEAQAQETARELKESLENAADQAENGAEGGGAETPPTPGAPTPTGPVSAPGQPDPSGSASGSEPQAAQEPGGQPQAGGEGPAGGQESGAGSEPGAPAGGSAGAEEGGEEPSGGAGSNPDRRSGDQSGGDSGMQGAREVSRRLEQQRQDSAARSRAAERFQERAERLSQGTPGASTGPGAGAAGERPTVRTGESAGRNESLLTDDLDVRRRAASDRVLAEVDAEGPALPQGGRTRGDAERELWRAAPGAERALENQGVPARFRDLVKRYFRQPAGTDPGAAPLAPVPERADPS